MKNYVKPVVLANEEMAEGIYAASGCYTTSWEIHQVPECGRIDYRIQVNAKHDADHVRDRQVFYYNFSAPVWHVQTQGKYIAGDGTNTIIIEYGYHQNMQDNIGFGDLIVRCNTTPTVNSINIVD